MGTGRLRSGKQRCALRTGKKPSAARHLLCLRAAERFELAVTDHTHGFDWPADRELPEDASECGRGVFLINALTDERHYMRSGARNCLWMARRRTHTQGSARPGSAAEMEALLESMTEELVRRVRESSRHFPLQLRSA